MVILSARAVTKTYPASAGPVSVLSNLDFELASGDRVAIVGTSGAGKSTLLNILGGLDTPSAGVVHLGTKELTSLNETELCQWRNQNLGFVFQFHHLMPEFTALEAVAMPARIGGISQREASASAEALLARLGLSERMHHRPSQLSGGERQRVAIARALINRPLCVLMDEPTGNLDPHTAESVMALMRELDFQSTALVVVTHDPHVAERMDRQYRTVRWQTQFDGITMRWPTRFHWEIAARQALDPGLGLSAFLSKLSIVGMLIAVSLLLAALSVMNGFEREMRVRILNLVPHVTVRGFAMDSEWQQVVDEVEPIESVTRHSQFSDIDALFTIRGEARVVRLIIADSSALNGLESYITPTSERISSDELILGGALAEELNLRVGDVVSVLLSGGTGRKTLIPRNLKLVATLNSETEIDRYFAFSGQGMNTTQALANQAHAITLADPLQARVFAATLRQTLSSQFWVSDWTESQGNLYQAIQLSRQIVSLMLASLLLIAIFNIVTSLVLVASDRSASSAMLRAMGASRGDISTIFVIQGTIIGVGGAALGALLGVVLAVSAPYLVSLVESLQGAALLDTRVYPLAYVPVDLRLRDFILVPSLAFVLSVISCAVPAITASRLPISQGLMQSR